MNLNSFKILKEDANSYHVGHPNGKTLVVDKSGLSDKAKQALKKYALGGAIEGEDSDTSVTPNTDAPPSAPSIGQSVENAASNFVNTFTPNVYYDNDGNKLAVPQPLVGGNENAAQVLDSPLVPKDDASTKQESASGEDASKTTPENNVAPASVPNQSTPNASPTPSALQGGTSGLNMQMAAEKQLANVKGQEGSAEASAIGDTQNKIDQLPSAMDIIAKQKEADAAAMQAFSNQKIDPNRFINNMSTGHKVLAGLGLLFSGFGSGTTGGPNLALQQINKSVENDIDAQKKEQSKQMSLWKMNREALGTDLAATLATKQQMYTTLQYKLQQSAAQFKGPEAQAAAQMGMGKIQQEKDNLARQQALLNPTLETAGGAQPGSEQAAVNHANTLRQAVQLGVVKPEVLKDFSDRLLPGIGITQVTPTPADRTELTNYDSLEKNLTKALAFQQSGPGAGIGAWSMAHRREAGVIQQGIKNSLDQLGDIKRLSPEMSKGFDKIAGDPGSFDAFGGNAAGFKEALNLVSTRKKALTNSLGVQPFQKAPIDQAAVAWAQKNPNDSRSAQILQQNGVSH